jgi:RluA family pseudouridine synthase
MLHEPMYTHLPQKNELSCIISQEESGIRLDTFLSRRFTYYSRHKWQELINNGQVFINTIRVVKSSVKIHQNDTIVFQPDNIFEPEVNKNYNILFHDDALIIVNKPADLPVHPAGIYRSNTLQTLLENNLQKKVYPLHRIDRETSGCIAFALSSESARLSLAHYSQWEKKYTAIVRGTFNEEKIITMPIGKDFNSSVLKKRAAYEGADENATTILKPVKTLSGATLLSAIPVTGRTHQIRVHCLYTGHPILGDRLYGINENLYLDFISGKPSHDGSGFTRTALHASELSLPHPVTSKTISVRAELPDDFIQYIKGHGAED